MVIIEIGHKSGVSAPLRRPSKKRLAARIASLARMLKSKPKGLRKVAKEPQEKKPLSQFRVEIKTLGGRYEE